MRTCQELIDLEKIISQYSSWIRHRTLARVSHRGQTFPIHVVEIGASRQDLPVVGFFGGVHGLEKIGSEVLLAYLNAVLQRLNWDETFREDMTKIRLIFVPIVNPVGVAFQTRSNGNGVDLMRNLPLNSDEDGGLIYRGHRLSAKLPYFRGVEGQLEVESHAVAELIEKEFFPAPVSFAIDVHSGFGARDRFWFPYAHSRKAFPHLAEVHALKELFDRTYPNHLYEIEPMSRRYTIHGDLWDWIYLKQRHLHSRNGFIPWTLEMGSWVWLKKNPWQLFSPYNVWHPILPHRRKRILRRHVVLFDFMVAAARSNRGWWQLPDDRRRHHEVQANEAWYG